MALAEEISLKHVLMTHNPHFASIVKEHEDHEHQLSTLTSRHVLTPSEERNVHVIKKRKLFLRDQMEHMLEAYKHRRHLAKHD